MRVAVRVRDYDQLRAALASRRRALGLRQLDLDELAGTQTGYVSKIEAGIRHLGPLSLPMILAGLDCDLLLCPRSDAAPVDHRGLSADKADNFDRVALPPTGEC
jgi:transcriptional regulator with XRE-family HTH domain